MCSLNMLAFDAKRCSNSAGGDRVQHGTVTQIGREIGMHV